MSFDLKIRTYTLVGIMTTGLIIRAGMPLALVTDGQTLFLLKATNFYKHNFSYDIIGSKITIYPYSLNSPEIENLYI